MDTKGQSDDAPPLGWSCCARVVDDPSSTLGTVGSSSRALTFEGTQEFWLADFGFDGDGWDHKKLTPPEHIHTDQHLARWVLEVVPCAIGFSRHPHFWEDSECKFMTAVLREGEHSTAKDSWPLFMYREEPPPLKEFFLEIPAPLPDIVNLRDVSTASKGGVKLNPGILFRSSHCFNQEQLDR